MATWNTFQHVHAPSMDKVMSGTDIWGVGCVWGGSQWGWWNTGHGEVLTLSPLRGRVAMIVPDISTPLASLCIVCASACVWFCVLAW